MSTAPSIQNTKITASTVSTTEELHTQYAEHTDENELNYDDT